MFMFRKAFNLIDRTGSTVSEIIFAFPIIVSAVLIYWFVRRKNFKKRIPDYKQALKKARLNEIVRLLFVFWAAGVVSLTVFQSGFWGNFWYTFVFRTIPAPAPPNRLHWDLVPDFLNYALNGFKISADDLDYFITNTLLNIALFVPLGLLLPFVWKKANPAKTVLVGFICTLVIEAVQPFARRNGDIDDVIFNTFGVLIGYLLYLLIKKLFPKFTANSKITVKEAAND